ncbi:hypothetical protein GCM10020000_60830 [Streptomyces olivoverticillatus]
MRGAFAALGVGGGQGGQAAGDFQAVELGHADVEEEDVGAVPLDRLQGLLAVHDVGDDVDVGLAFEDHAESGADHFLVVRDDHADRHDVPRPSRWSSDLMSPGVPRRRNRSGPGPAQSSVRPLRRSATCTP